MQISHSHNLAVLLCMKVIIGINGLPLISVDNGSVLPRQGITTPLGIDVKDLDLGDISPIEDGWLELDSDDGDGNDLGSSSVSNANGYLGSIGSGQASQNGKSLEGSSAACSLTGCVTSAAASNGNQTSSSSTSTGGLISAPSISGPLIEINN
ncbi:uncharacterized protein TRUGW13939_04864 [Talaromyces rugulosus]|uniref:Uncharacterized protein n=1 Tax=Talaromyces rugulosus TaxID=121627 RepID=A0A7H8QUR0_TALRU|nr:uncharacterized protein TRUGW13939_04864 [Talaromyces rugulosus]QKX57744.1 hypothetical protein TRUGW13939_04864 [Talaromyces rugulosus]